MSDFSEYQNAKEITRRYRAEREAADARLDKAMMQERMAELISQHEPVASMGIDRDKLREAILYIRTGRVV